MRAEVKTIPDDDWGGSFGLSLDHLLVCMQREKGYFRSARACSRNKARSCFTKGSGSQICWTDWTGFFYSQLHCSVLPSCPRGMFQPRLQVEAFKRYCGVVRGRVWAIEALFTTPCRRCTKGDARVAVGKLFKLAQWLPFIINKLTRDDTRAEAELLRLDICIRVCVPVRPPWQL